MNELLERSAPLLSTQHSLITNRQCRDLWDAESQLRTLLGRGIWETIERRLYGPVGVAMTWRRRLMAAALLAPAGSLISHRPAAALLGAGGLHEPEPEVTIPRGTTFRRPWVATHESTDLDLADVVIVDGIPTTGPCRVAMDVGSVMSPARYTHTVRELRHGTGVTREQLLRTYLRHKRRGRNGGAALRDWLDRYFVVSGTPESGLEQVVLDALLDAGLPTPVLQHWVSTPGGSFRLDLAYPTEKMAVEVDGAQHEDEDVKRNDRRRTKLLEACGWTVIRIRSRHLATDLHAAIVELRRHLVSQ